MRFLIVFFVSLWICSLGGCNVSKRAQGILHAGISGLRFLDVFEVPNTMVFKGTRVGGLSGIDYDADRDRYYLVCDDPSAHNPARFYTARIQLAGEKIDTVLFESVDTLLNSEGKPYPDITKDLLHSADVEAMRYDPSRDELVWSTEGQRLFRDSAWKLQDPAIIISDRKGRYKDSFALPVNMHMSYEEKGPRHNSVFEGLDFSEGYASLFVSLEESLHEDGHKAGTGDSTSWIRILHFDRIKKESIAQYAYPIDAVPHQPNPVNGFRTNGVSDILYLGKDKFIVAERAYSSGRVSTDLRLYIADATRAEKVSPTASLAESPVKKPLVKKLLLDVTGTLGIDVFNIEGITFGPTLPNGHRSVLMVTDNNFNSKEKTQFFLFDVLP